LQGVTVKNKRSLDATRTLGRDKYCWNG